MSDRLTVSSDARWPAATGIGVVMEAMLQRLPADMDLKPLAIPGSIGSPLSPVHISQALKFEGDVFWSAGFVPPAWGKTPVTVTVHDLTHLHYYGPAKRLYYDVALRPLYRSASAIICVSDFTRNEFLDWSGVDPSRVHTVHNGVDEAFKRNRNVAAAEYPFVLYPGNRRSYKNLHRLIRAYAQSDLPHLGVRLALTGPESADVSALAAELDLVDMIQSLGFIETEDLPALYRAALAIVYVSLYEGFGLPILEGMASETPVLASNVSAIPEVAGDAAILVDPLALDEMADGLNRIVADTDLRDGLIAAGLRRVSAFDWDRSAAKLWDVVRATRP